MTRHREVILSSIKWAFMSTMVIPLLELIHIRQYI